MKGRGFKKTITTDRVVRPPDNLSKSLPHPLPTRRRQNCRDSRGQIPTSAPIKQGIRIPCFLASIGDFELKSAKLADFSPRWARWARWAGPHKRRGEGRGRVWGSMGKSYGGWQGMLRRRPWSRRKWPTRRIRIRRDKVVWRWLPELVTEKLEEEKDDN